MDKTNFWKGYGGFLMKLLYGLLLTLCVTISSAQTFTQVGQINYVCSDIDFDQSGRMWLIRQQGTLHCNYALVRTFPVQFVNECGLVGLEMSGQYAYLHISGQDSVQRVIRYDTVTYAIDTIVEVPYKNPFSNRHRGGDIFVDGNDLYCSFGYGANGQDAQNLDDYRGKLLKINLTTLVVDIVAHGLRNPYRFDFSPSSNDGFISDVGSDISEEINYFTENYSFLNMGWPCYEDTIQLLDPDTMCNGYAYSFPEFSYNQTQPRSIIGGCFLHGNYYFCDHFKDPDTLNYVFGGYIDVNWVFHQSAVSFPQNVTGMALNSYSGTIHLSTWGGKIYEMTELPLSIDPDTAGDSDERYKHGIYISESGIIVNWSELPGTISIFSITGQRVFTSSMDSSGAFWLDHLPSGMYCITVHTPRGIQYVKKFIKISR